MSVGSVPLLWDTSTAPSAFDPEDWLAHREAVTGRHRPRLPSLGVQTVDTAVWEAALVRADGAPDDFTGAGHPFVVLERDHGSVAVALSAKGSYAAGGLDELLALGVRSCVVVGGAGALVDGLPPGALVVADRALRDDGVSHHYVPPGRWVDADGPMTTALAEACPAVTVGPVWTTTAHFRQTVPRLEAFRAEGCVAVDNETAGAFAVGVARGAAVARLLVIGDSLADGRFRAPVRAQPSHGVSTLDVALAALDAVGTGGAAA
jgi:nucleoside phosphorylase